MSKPKKHRQQRGSSFKLETFLVNYGLQTAGILLIIGGLAYLFSSNYNHYFLVELWNSFIKPDIGKTHITSHTGTTLPGYLSLLIHIPGLLILGFTYFMRANNTGIRNILVSSGFIWLIFSQGKVLLDIRDHSIELNYYLVIVSFGIIQAIATTVSIAAKNRLALIWSVIYFFVSIILIRLIYGVILPNIIFLILFQVAVSLSCYIFKWRTPFILLMTLSAVYISYYFIKLVIIGGSGAAPLTFMLPGLLVWFILSTTGFGILKSASKLKIITFIWDYLPYIALLNVLLLTLGYYYKSGSNSLSLLYYSIAVISLIIITVFNRKYSFIKHEDPFYLSLCIFSAFLLPQFLGGGFLLILSASLAVTLLINVLLTGLKVSFQVSMGLFFISLGLYLADWAFRIIPALITQNSAGTLYSTQIVVGSVLFFALSYFYHRLYTQLPEEFSFSQTQTKKYGNSVGLAYNIILYLTVFLVLDYICILLIPGYRVNFIEWGLYSYLYLYFIINSKNSKSRTNLRYVFLLTLPAVILYPLVIHPETIHFRTLYLAGETSALLPFIMHYICLGVMILILLNINGRLGLLYPKSRIISNFRMLLGIVFLCFILLSEYDHLLLLSISRFGSQSAYEMLQYNKFIPYSVILFSVSIVLLVFSLIHYTRFLRRLSMFMILLVLLKVLFIDITILPANTSIILLISLGAILIALSFLIPRFRKQSPVNKST